ncbi:hypothetical protein ACLB1Q_21045 [Escherichia coli]
MLNPMDFEFREGGKFIHPRELTEVSDPGETQPKRAVENLKDEGFPHKDVYTSIIGGYCIFLKRKLFMPK